jgi:hypothetical protein
MMLCSDRDDGLWNRGGEFDGRGLVDRREFVDGRGLVDRVSLLMAVG